MAAVSTSNPGHINEAAPRYSGQRPSLGASSAVLHPGGSVQHDDGIVSDATMGRAAAITRIEQDAPADDPVSFQAETDASKADEPLATLDDAIRAHIVRALGRSRGRIEGRGGAAHLLGVNPHTLRGKMRRLKIEWSRYRA